LNFELKISIVKRTIALNTGNSGSIMHMKGNETMYIRNNYNNSKAIWFMVICINMTTISVILLGCYFKLASIDKSLIKQTQMMKDEMEEINVPEEDIAPEVGTTRLVITAYTADKPGKLTAIAIKPTPGWTCAVSRDMAHWLGGKVWIEGIGVRHVPDFTHEHIRNRVNALVGKRQEVVYIGDTERKVVFLGKG
jgi:3D (Asp-Asp-Asp) domain-containing protein